MPIFLALSLPPEPVWLAAGVTDGQSAPSREAATTRSPTSGRRVLLVDDNVDGAESLALMLRINGHDTRTAHNVPEALAAARPFKPDVVFLDIGLPGMDGYEVSKQMRWEPSLNGAVLFGLIGWGSKHDKRQSSQVGFEFHLTKPVGATAIEGILARVDGGQGPA
jgi:CheY-like chemotaxis protein